MTSERLPQLRRDLTVVATDADGCVVLDVAERVQFEGDGGDRALLGLLDGRHDVDELAAELHVRPGPPISKHRIRSRLDSFAEAGLIEGDSADPETGATTHGVPGTSWLMATWIRFVGAVARPITLVPLAAVTWLGLSALVDQSSRLWRELALWLMHPPPAPLVVASYVQTLVLENIPRALIEGALCARTGATFRGIRVFWLGKIVPIFVANVRGSPRARTARERWTLMLSSLAYQFGLCMVTAVAWHQSRSGSLPGAFWLLLLPPTALMVVIRLNPFAPQVGQALLSAAVGYPQLFVRAREETLAWLGLGHSPPAATERQRFWLRVYGIGTFAWDLILTVGLVILLGWWLTGRWGGFGAFIGIVMLVAHFQTPIRRIVMSNPLSRALARYEDRAWWRWGVRLAVLLVIVLIGLIPYDYEVGGDVRIVPKAEYGIRAQIAGEIATVNVTEGQPVEAGAMIATISARDQLAAVETTKAELEKERADLALLEAGAAPQDIAKAEHEVEQKRAERDFALTDLARNQALLRGGAVTQSTIDKSIRTRDSTEQSLQAALQGLARLRAGARDEEIRAARATVARLEAQLAHDQEMLSLREMTTPIQGRVSTLDLGVKVGQYVNRGDLIAVVQDTSSLVARLAADQAAAVNIKPQFKASVRLDALDGSLIEGTVLRIAPVAQNQAVLDTDSFRTDQETQFAQSKQEDDPQLVGVEVSLDSAPPGLVPGMTGYGRVKIRDDVFWRALARPVLRFFRVEVWSWLP